MSDVSQILIAIQEGQEEASAELLPFVYDELRALARRQLDDERPEHTLQPTALVHEAYIRLVGSEQGQTWRSRRHFFDAAARSMRRILIDSARAKKAAKRGGGAKQFDIDLGEIGVNQQAEQLILLDEALDRLAEQDPRAKEVVELRFFGGLTLKQVAKALDISVATAERDWAYARLWLREEMSTQA